MRGENRQRLLYSILQEYTLAAATYSKGKDRPGKVANPARGQLNRENENFPGPVRA